MVWHRCKLHFVYCVALCTIITDLSRRLQVDLTTALGIYEALRNVIIGSLVVCVAGLLPGYYATLLLIDVWAGGQSSFPDLQC